MRRTGLKRLALIGLPVVVVAALSFAAVSSGRSTATKSTFGVNATGTVQFWTRAATSGVGVALVKKFNATHPGLKVVLSQTSPNQDTSKLATAIRAHAVPDVVGLNDIDVPQFSRLNALTDISKLVDALPYKGALSPGHLALAVYNGKYYGVPYLGDLSVLWYNKALFKQAGLDPNKPPASFADILNDAKKIQALGNGISGFGMAGNCQGCLGFVMEPHLFAVKNQLIRGAIGHQTAAIQGNTQLVRAAQAVPAALAAEARLSGQPDRVRARPGRTSSSRARSASSRARTASIRESSRRGSSRTSASRRSPARPVATRRSTAVTTSSSRRARRTPPEPGSSSSGSSRRHSRCSIRASATRRCARTS